MKLKVKTNQAEVSRWIKRVYKDQVPYATSLALNDTAFEVRKEIVDHTYPEAFDLKNKRFPSIATNVKKAKKTELTASVGNLKAKPWRYLDLHARSGVNSPDGKHIAVPSRDMRDEFPGKIKKSQRPKAIMKRKGGFIFKTRKKGIPVIAYRKPKRGKKGQSGEIEIKYILIEYAKIDKELMFYEDAKRIINQRYTQNFVRAFKRAIRTAK